MECLLVMCVMKSSRFGQYLHVLIVFWWLQGSSSSCLQEKPNPTAVHGNAKHHLTEGKLDPTSLMTRLPLCRPGRKFLRGTQMLRWTRSPCSDKYVVLKEIQHSSVSQNQNQMELHKGVPEYVWHLGGGSCGGCGVLRPSSVSAQFNRCAIERGALGELARWIKENFRQIEHRKSTCL